MSSRQRRSSYVQILKTLSHKIEQQRLNENEYSHNNQMDLLTESIFHGNCYGLSAYVIGLASKEALTEIIDYMKINTHIEMTFDVQGLPAPLHYVAFIEALENKVINSLYWSPLRNFHQLKRGDIITYTTHNERPRACWGQHIMFVISKPFVKRNQVHIKILDATAYPHGLGDSRQLKETGLGMGFITIYLNDKEEAYQIQWSCNTKPLRRCIKVMRFKL